MSCTITFPEFSKAKDAVGVVATWYVRSGESVHAGQVIAEASVDKVSVDVEAPVDGVVTCLVEEEAEIQQGAPIATID